MTASLSAASFPTKQNLSAYADATCILVSWPVVEDQLFLVSILHNEVSPILLPNGPGNASVTAHPGCFGFWE